MSNLPHLGQENTYISPENQGIGDMPVRHPEQAPIERYSPTSPVVIPTPKIHKIEEVVTPPPSADTSVPPVRYDVPLDTLLSRAARLKPHIARAWDAMLAAIARDR